jgi:hypothetical protein
VWRTRVKAETYCSCRHLHLGNGKTLSDPEATVKKRQLSVCTEMSVGLDLATPTQHDTIAISLLMV